MHRAGLALALALAQTASWATLITLCILAGLMMSGQMVAMRVEGSSMQPSVSQGDLVLVWHQSRYRAGDVVSYSASWISSDGPHVLHRIVREDPSGWTLKGDNNPVEDPALVRPHQVHGKMMARIPGGATWLKMLQSMLWVSAGAGALCILIWPYARIRMRGTA